jgi:hypothetical protein
VADRDPSIRTRKDVIAALRRGVVPEAGLALFATGMDRYVRVLDDELTDAAAGRGVFKAVRADYGGGKTFFARWLEARALEKGFAAAEVQVSETETPLYKLETVYRRAMERLATASVARNAFRSVVDGWLFGLEDELRAAGELKSDDPDTVAEAVGKALEQRLARVSAVNRSFAASLRAYHKAVLAADEPLAEGLIAWVSGQPNVAASVKRAADVKGEIDARAALTFFQGLLVVLRESGHKGLVLVLDEVETVQRQPRNIRDRSLNELRHLIDELDGGHLPGLYLLITGTPPFFEGRDGVKRLPPLDQRLSVNFGPDSRKDNLRQPQVRLLPFERPRLLEVGHRVRDLYPSSDDSVAKRVTDGVISGLAETVTGKLGGQVGIAPRLYLRTLVDVLDRTNDQPDYDPATDYKVTIDPVNDMTPEERLRAGYALGPDDIAALRVSDEDDAPPEPASRASDVRLEGLDP